MKNINVNSLTDDQLLEFVMKENKSYEKRKECNKRWRMKNFDKVQQYHKRYNQEKKEFINQIKQELEKRNSN